MVNCELENSGEDHVVASSSSSFPQGGKPQIKEEEKPSPSEPEKHPENPVAVGQDCVSRIVKMFVLHLAD